jgi:hypothetical protein
VLSHVCKKQKMEKWKADFHFFSDGRLIVIIKSAVFKESVNGFKAKGTK